MTTAPDIEMYCVLDVNDLFSIAILLVSTIILWQLRIVNGQPPLPAVKTGFWPVAKPRIFYHERMKAPSNQTNLVRIKPKEFMCKTKPQNPSLFRVNAPVVTQCKCKGFIYCSFIKIYARFCKKVWKMVSWSSPFLNVRWI